MTEGPIKTGLFGLPVYPDDCIPAWCRMPLSAHHDGTGGCWGISYGFVALHGREHCKTCEYHQAQQEVA